MKIAIRKGRVIDPASKFDAVADVFIAAGKVIAIGEQPADWASKMPTAASSHRGWLILRCM
jgi:dihydroorotase